MLAKQIDFRVRGDPVDWWDKFLTYQPRRTKENIGVQPQQICIIYERFLRYRFLSDIMNLKFSKCYILA